MPGLRDFIKQNVGKAGINAAFFGPDIAKDLGDSQNRLRGIAKAMADIYFWTAKWLAPLRGAIYGGWAILGFKAMGAMVRGLVKDTDSLSAALRRLNSIQGFQRQFAPLVGGIEAAKNRLASLLQLSSRGPFKFEDLAQASHSLEVSTRGSFSGTGATQTIGKAAIATGNGITDVADAVGDFYNNLRQGQPIESATERLRQMGLVSQQVANQLTDMAHGGASTTEMANALVRNLENVSQSAKQFKDDLFAVTAEHERAKEELMVRFGAPWTEKEIQNTKNMTVAMRAIGPTVGSISAFFEKLTNGFSTFGSQMLKSAAGNTVARSTVEGLIKSLGVLLAIAATIGTVTLPMLIGTVIRWTAAMYAVGGASTVAAVGIRVLAGVIVAGGLVAGLIAVAGAVYGFVRSFHEAHKRVQDMERAIRQTNNAIREQIRNVQTLADRHDALAEAINGVIDAQEKYNEVREKYFSGDTGTTQKELDTAKKGVDEALKTFQEASRVSTIGLTGPAQDAATRKVIERRQMEEESAFQRRMTTISPLKRIEAQRSRAALLEGRAGVGFQGIEGRAQLERETAGLEQQKQVQRAVRESALKEVEGAEKAKAATINTANKKVFQQQIDEAKKRAKIASTEELKIDAEMLQKRLHGRNESERESAQAEILGHAVRAGAAESAGDNRIAAQEKILSNGRVIRGEQERQDALEEKHFHEMEAARLKGREDQAVDNEEQSNSLKAQADAEERRITIRKQEISNEIRAREERLSGHPAAARQFEDINKFISHMQENIAEGFSKEGATKLAQRQTRADILETIPPGGLRSVADNLTKIGGGGEVYTPGGDPMQALAQRQANIQKAILEFLERNYKEGGVY